MSRASGQKHITSADLASLPLGDLIAAVSGAFAREPVLLRLQGPYVVVGDLHGGIDDLLQILGDQGYPPDRSYLFLGDYVDRGANSIEVLLVLYVLKYLFPEHVYLLRGNHECVAICQKYGFQKECDDFFPSKAIYNSFCQSFAHLPVAAVLNDKVFCVHGGLSPKIETLFDITALTIKPLKNIRHSLTEDLLWGDPSNDCDRFGESTRGAGFLFDSVVTEEFLERNDLTLMIRAHEFCEDGTRWAFDRCLTVFSAGNYGHKGNIGAVVVVDEEGEVEICQMRKQSRDRLLLLLPVWYLEHQIVDEVFSEDLGDIESPWIF